MHHTYLEMLYLYNIIDIIHLLVEGQNCRSLQYLVLKYKLLKLGAEVLKFEYGEGLVF